MTIWDFYGFIESYCQTTIPFKNLFFIKIRWENWNKIKLWGETNKLLHSFQFLFHWEHCTCETSATDQFEEVYSATNLPMREGNLDFISI